MLKSNYCGLINAVLYKCKLPQYSVVKDISMAERLAYSAREDEMENLTEIYFKNIAQFGHIQIQFKCSHLAARC